MKRTQRNQNFENDEKKNKNIPLIKRFDKLKQPPPKPFIKSRYVDLLGIGIIILLGILVYSNSFSCSFHFDDISKIVDNMKIRNLSDVKTIWNYSQTRFTAYYSFAINYHFDKLNVWGYHLFNLIIHLINACLVYWLTLLIFSSPAVKEHTNLKNKKLLAFITAILYVSHPLATQSVIYIVQRMASMVALFYLLSLALYIKGRLTRKSNLLKFTLFVGALISAILAMLSKENAFTLPFAIVLVEIFFLQTKKLSINFKDYRTILIVAGFLGFILIVLFTFSFNIFNPILPNETNDYRLVTSQGYLFTQFSVIVKYIQLLFLPINQNLDYDFPISNSFFEISTITSFFLLLSLIILAIFLFKKNRIISFGIFWFFLTLSIESSIIPISDLIIEHRTYLPSFGFFLIISLGIYLLLWDKYKYIAISVFAIIIGSNSFLTYERNKVWKDEITLWSDVISKSPNKARAYDTRGVALIQKDKRFEEAIKDFNKAIELSPNYARAYINRGTLFLNNNRYDEALKDFNKAIELKPFFPIAFFNRGALLQNNNRRDEALEDFNRAIDQKPDYAEAYNNRGVLFYTENRNEEALEDYNKAIEINPEHVLAYFNRGALHRANNQQDEALKDFNKAIELNPDYSEAYNSRGNIYRNKNRYDEALKDFNKAIEINPDFAEAYVNRGMLFRVNNRLDEALKDYIKAIELNPDYFQAYYNRGNLYLSEERVVEALKDFNKAIEINPDYVDAYINRGTLFLNEKRNQEALKDYNKAITLKPNLAEAYANRGIVKFNTGNNDSACIDFQKAAGLGLQLGTEMYNKYCR